MKIKLLVKDQEIYGDIFEANVTKSGTSAHIPFYKRYIGKKVMIILPIGTTEWKLNESDLSEFIYFCTETLEKMPKNKENFFERCALENVISKKFSKEDLRRVIKLLNEKEECRQLIARIWRAHKLERC